MANLVRGTILLGLITLLSCSEAPVQPPPPAAQGYPVYFHAENSPDQWYVYYPETDYLDTLTLPTATGSWAALAPDGNRLFMAATAGYSLSVVDIESRSVIHDFPYGTYSADISNDGSKIVVDHLDGADIFNTNDLSTIYHNDTSPIGRVHFSWDGTRIIGINNANLLDYVWSYTSAPSSITSESISVPGYLATAGRILTTPLNNDWYLLIYPWSFAAWDFDNDTVVFTDSLKIGSVYPQNEISPNGKYIAYLNKKVTSTSYTELRIYDVSLGQIVFSQETIIPDLPPDEGLFEVTELEFTPDSKWLFGTSFGQKSYLMVFNMDDLNIERFVETPIEGGLINPVCQTGL